MSLTKKFVFFGQRYDNTEVDIKIARLNNSIKAKDTTIDNQLETIDIKDMQIKDLSNENSSLKIELENLKASLNQDDALVKVNEELAIYKQFVETLKTPVVFKDANGNPVHYLQPFLHLNENLNLDHLSENYPLTDKEDQEIMAQMREMGIKDYTIQFGEFKRALGLPVKTLPVSDVPLKR